MRLGWVSVYMCRHHLITGSHVTEVRTFAQRVEAIAGTLGDVPLQVAAQYYLVFVCHASGDYRGTEHVSRRLTQLLQGNRIRERFRLAVFPAMWSRAFLARALAERGVFDEGDSQGQEAVRIAEAVDHQFSVIFACLGLAYVNSVRGELSQAARLLERALALCRDWSITIVTPVAMASLGHVYAWSGRVGEGVALLQQALTVHESAGIAWLQAMSIVQLGEGYLLAGQVEDARACADRAVRLACERGERGHEAWALRLLGEIASHPDHPDAAAAEVHYGTAMALAFELGMRPLVAHCHLGLGKLYRRTRDHAKAEEYLATASAMYREMDMRFWLEKAEAACAGGGP
jgi:tetratricopeptide (TPR) repeat protein